MVKKFNNLPYFDSNKLIFGENSLQKNLKKNLSSIM